jgi:integrase
MAKRKAANGSGCIRQRVDGTWEARVTTGRDPGTGKLIRKSYYGKTQAEVRKKLTASAHELDEGTYMEPSKMTVGQWLDVWSVEYLGALKPRTYDLYLQHIRVHLKPALGALKLQALTTPIIQKMYNQKLRAGLSPKTIKNLHGVLHKALSQAVKVEYLRFNPADACELPRCQPREMHLLDNNQVALFLKAVDGHRHQNLLTVTLFTGLREAEVLGLSWDEVNFETGVLSISHQLQRRKPEAGEVTYTFAPLKNDRPRTIKPAASVMAVLRRQRQLQLEWRLKAGDAWSNPLDLVFTNEIGQYICVNTIYHAFKKIVASLGLEETRFHDLRHTYATLSIQNGDDIKTVSTSLGHATTAFTLDVYGHSTDSMKQASADRMEAFIKSIR